MKKIIKNIALPIVFLCCFAFVGTAQSKQVPNNYVSTVKKQQTKKVSSMNMDAAKEKLAKIHPKKTTSYSIDKNNKRKLILKED